MAENKLAESIIEPVNENNIFQLPLNHASFSLKDRIIEL
jgi:hypothetical protein